MKRIFAGSASCALFLLARYSQFGSRNSRMGSVSHGLDPAKGGNSSQRTRRHEAAVRDLR